MITLYIGQDNYWHARMPDDGQVLLHPAATPTTRETWASERPHMMRMAWQYWLQQVAREGCTH